MENQTNETVLTVEDIMEQPTKSVKDIADAFDVRSDTVLGWLQRGYFPHAYKQGPMKRSRWAIPEVDYINFLKNLTGLPSKADLLTEPEDDDSS